MPSRKLNLPPLPKGFFVAGTTAGIKPSGLPDMSLLVSDRPASAAGVFTTSRCPSAPVLVDRRHLRAGLARAVIVNSGNANASTGDPGIQNARRMCALTAAALGLPRAGDVLVGSTGIIGVPLPMDRIERGIATLASRLGRSRDHVEAAARGIMTTDLAMKTATRSVRIGKTSVRLTGLCKGSGMIAPNMATMLAYVMTDAKISPAALRQAVKAAAAASFNRISVDQHTSPSDTLLVLANGAAGAAPIDKLRGLQGFRGFRGALTDLCCELAERIVRDGEGVTKLIRLRVTGGRSEKEADAVARAVINSPLVKTAVHGGDPNWGRIVTAAGYSGVPLDPRKMGLTIGQVRVFERGVPAALALAARRRLHRAMSGGEVAVELTLGRGGAAVQWLGCDLSRQYIAINADYTT